MLELSVCGAAAFLCLFLKKIFACAKVVASGHVAAGQNFFLSAGFFLFLRHSCSMASAVERKLALARTKPARLTKPVSMRYARLTKPASMC